MEESIKEKKKRSALIIMILTLVISITGATYAFFSITPAVNNVVTGKAATAELDLAIQRLMPTTSGWSTSNKVMIPQLTSDIGTAMNDTNNCLDQSGNVTCQLYQIVVQNTGTAQVVVNGTVTFTGTTNMPNLKWKFYENNTQLNNSNVNTFLAPTTTRTITEGQANTISNGITLKPKGVTGDTKYYYVILWIESLMNEDGTPAVQLDHGIYKATVHFESSNGTGVTSTFTS